MSDAAEPVVFTAADYKYFTDRLFELEQGLGTPPADNELAVRLHEVVATLSTALRDALEDYAVLARIIPPDTAWVGDYAHYVESAKRRLEIDLGPLT